MNYSLERLAREGHGAIQVEEASINPLLVFLAGPIKVWWNLSDEEWGRGEHGIYLEWRSAVQAACVKAGFLVYSPFQAWRGSWSNEAQSVNNFAIVSCDVFIDLTPKGVLADGTEAEKEFARKHGRHIVNLPPSEVESLAWTIEGLHNFHAMLLSWDGE